MSLPLVSDIFEYVRDNNSLPETFPSFTGKLSGKYTYITKMVFVAIVILTPQILKYFMICYVHLVVLFIPIADLISPNTHTILIDFSIVY